MLLHVLHRNLIKSSTTIIIGHNHSRRRCHRHRHHYSFSNTNIIEQLLLRLRIPASRRECKSIRNIFYTLVKSGEDPEILEGGAKPGVWGRKSPAGSRGRAPVGGLGDQKLKGFSE